MEKRFDAACSLNSDAASLKRRPTGMTSPLGAQRGVISQDRQAAKSGELYKAASNPLFKQLTFSRLESRKRLHSLKSCTFSAEELQTIRKSASIKLSRYKTSLIKSSSGRVEYMNRRGIFPPWVNKLRDQTTIEVKVNARKRSEFKELISKEMQCLIKRKQLSMHIPSGPPSPSDAQRVEQASKKQLVSKLQKLLVNSTIKPEKNKISIEPERIETDPRRHGERIQWLASHGIKERIVPSFHKTMPLLKMTVKCKSE